MPDIPDWITPLTDALLLIPLVVLIVRAVGLRAFAKMSAHDFIVTVATGSTLAATVLNYDIPWWQGAVALVAVLGVQVAVGLVRAHVPGMERAMDNEPMVLMRGGVPDEAALGRARMTLDDLRQVLRRQGVARMDAAALVVLETTGDVSVLEEAPEAGLVREVRGA